MRSISDFIADNSEGLLRHGRVYDRFSSLVKIWSSAPLITSRLTPGSQNVATNNIFGLSKKCQGLHGCI